MTLEEFKSAKAALEFDLLNLVAERCGRFTKETGLSAQWITVDTVAARRIGDALPEYLIERVKVDVPF